MADIYENSFITIAATKAEDASIGCFSKIDWRYIGGQLPGYTNVFVRRVPRRLDHSSAHKVLPVFLLEGEKDPCPLLDRGWTYQEFLLSPRTVHSGAHELEWRCVSAKRHQSTYGSSALLSDRLPPSLLGGQERITSPHSKSWHAYVETSSKKDLTFPKDRLPAIAAIAQRVSEIRKGDQYLAGLWKSTILEDLLWHASGIHADQFTADAFAQGSGVHTTLQVPTWSWAKMKGGVQWPNGSPAGQLRNVGVLGTVYEMHGPITSGEIVSAVIRLQAPLIPMSNLGNTALLRTLQDVEMNANNGIRDEVLQIETTREKVPGRMLELILTGYTLDTDLKWVHRRWWNDTLKKESVFAIPFIRPVWHDPARVDPIFTQGC